MAAGRIEFSYKKGILERDACGDIEPHWGKIKVLREINDFGVYCPLYYPELDNVVQEMCFFGWLEKRATLFSRKEEELVNFILNDSAFNNSLGLRNKYLHGTNSRVEIVNRRDYMIFLSVVVLIVLKMNEDLRLREPDEKRFSGVWNFVNDMEKC